MKDLFLMIEPYYTDEYATIYHADCREVLASLPPVDLVLTDPPYGIGGNVPRSSGGLSTRVEKLPQWDVFEIQWVDKLIPVLKYGANIVIFCDPKTIGQIWTLPLHPRQVIYWLKQHCPPNPRGCFRSAVETAVWLSNGSSPIWNGGGCTDNAWFGEIQRTERLHPTQKPLPLIVWLLQLFANKTSIVLDPFMGSGTTLVAAKQLGCKAIGIEIEEKYCAIAVERLRQEVLPFETVRYSKYTETQSPLFTQEFALEEM